MRAKRFRRWLLAAIACLVIAAGWAFVAIEHRTDPPLGFAVGARDALRPIDNHKGAPPRGWGSIEGTLVHSDGSPAGPSIVSAQAVGRADLPRVTVYAVAGRFRIPRLAAARYRLEAHDRVAQASAGQPIDVAPGAAVSTTIKLNHALTDPYPAAYYAARLRFPSKATQTDFRVQCRYCHQFGTAPTRIKRTPAEWNALIQIMSGMGAALDPKTRRVLPGVLANGMRPDRPTAPVPPGPAPDAVGTVIREWTLGMPGAYMHDLALGPGGWIYTVDMNHDTVDAVNARTDARWTSALPRRGHPRGGYFRVASQAIGTTEAHQGPHSVEFGPDGRLWITASLGNEVIAAQPKPNGATQHWSLPRGSFYPHTLRVRKNAVWFTIAITNQVGRLDPETGRFTIVQLPCSRFSQRAVRALMPFVFGMGSFWPGSNAQSKLSRWFGGTSSTPVPYGLDIAPDGGVWYAKLYDNRIGRIDPHTLKVKEWVTPFVAPRRLRVAPDGSVWIAAFGSSLLARFDPKTQKFKTWPLPSNPRGLEAPYAVAISPTGKIWVTGTQTDSLYRFDPKTQHFIVFPLPTRGAFMREIEFRPDGELCTSYSNNPDAHMPDPTRKVMCLKPPP